MASQIPGLDNPAQFTTTVPGVSLPRRQEFTEEGQAIAHAGQEIENVGRQGGAVYDEIQRQQDISTASKATIDAGVAHDQVVNTLKLTSPDGFVHDPDSGEIVKNADGSQRTIAQEYWAHADDDYKTRQQGMSPRAGAMFRQEFQRTIGENTKYLQNEGLLLQRKSSDGDLSASMDTMSRDNTRTPWPDKSPYYEDRNADGTVNLRGDTSKIDNQLRAIQLWTTRQGPKQGTPGLYNPTEVDKLMSKRLSDHADDWVQSALTDILENNTARDRKNKLSTTALQQVQNLRDVVEGRDPQSAERVAGRAPGTPPVPTVNNSLGSDQINKWRAKLDAYGAEAGDIDKSEYKLGVEQLKLSAHSATSLAQYIGSPLFQHTLHSGPALGIDPAETVKDLAEGVSTAVTSSGISAMTGLSSEDAKRAAAQKALHDAQQMWPQLAAKAGVKYTEGFGEAIIAEASRQVESKLQEDAKQQRTNPMGYAAGVEQGPHSGGVIKYRSPMAHAVETALGPGGDPSAFAIFKPMSNGKSVFENAQETANGVYARGFGPSADVMALQKSQFEDQKRRLLGSRDPAILESYFHQLNSQNVSDTQKEAFLHQLHEQGGLPQPYIDALNLKTPSERATRWTSLLAGSTSVQEWAKADGGQSPKYVSQLSQNNNRDLFSFIDMKFGQKSPQAIAAKSNYDQAWQSDYANARKRGLGESDAVEQANQVRTRTTGTLGVVGATHSVLGLTYSHPGPQVPVQYGSADLTDTQKQTINSNLLRYQSEQELQKYEFVPVPGAAPSNPNAPLPPSWVAKHPALWDRIPGGYRLRVQEMSPSGVPTGASQPVQIFDSQGRKKYYDVKDRDATAAPLGKK